MATYWGIVEGSLCRMTCTHSVSSSFLHSRRCQNRFLFLKSKVAFWYCLMGLKQQISKHRWWQLLSFGSGRPPELFSLWSRSVWWCHKSPRRWLGLCLHESLLRLHLGRMLKFHHSSYRCHKCAIWQTYLVSSVVELKCVFSTNRLDLRILRWWGHKVHQKKTWPKLASLHNYLLWCTELLPPWLVHRVPS